MLKEVKNIIFDLGGVLYAIDYSKTLKAFDALGIKDADQLYTKAGQSILFDDLEIGKISKTVFFNSLNDMIDNTLSEQNLKNAWNAMLLDFMPEVLEFLKKLKDDYRLFLLSNTNEIHIKEIEDRAGKEMFSNFLSLFDKVYLSHEIGMRKPHKEIFHFILNEQNLHATETLFIDDSIQHIKGALSANLKAYHLKEGERVFQLFP